MKIFMLHPHDIYSESEPWTIRILSLAREFTNGGHDVSLGYFPLTRGKLALPFYSDGIRMVPLSRKVSLLALLNNFIKLHKFVAWADIVHFQKCHHYASLPLLMASFIRAKPIHYDWDDWEAKIFLHSNRVSLTTLLVYYFFRTLENLLPLAVDTVSVSSKKLLEVCLGIGVHKDNISMAPVGADLEKFKPDVFSDDIKKKYNLDGPVILYLGQLHGGQYAELFIQAARLVLEHNAHSNFMVVGGGYRLNELRSLVSHLGIEKNIIFTDSLPHSLIPSHISMADICVACFEDNDITKCKSPLKIAEYLASGKAIVASNVGEVRNMVGGVGILTEPGDVKELAEAIIKLLNDGALRKEMGEKSRRRSERKYNWKVTAENIFRGYQTALYLNNIKIEEILIPARDFVRGNLSRNNDSFGRRMAIDSGVLPVFAEYEFYIPSDGRYELWVKYAAETLRPCRIYFDGRLLYADRLNEVSGGWTQDKARWFKQAALEIESKFHGIKFISEGCSPHLEFIKFKKINPLNF